MQPLAKAESGAYHGAASVNSSFDEAKAHIEGLDFDHSEPGPFRIFAVYSVGLKFL